MPENIIAFLDSTGFEDTLRKAVSLDGDSETIAAIGGSIADVFYKNIPQCIIAEALPRLDERLTAVVERWQNWLKQDRP